MSAQTKVTSVSQLKAGCVIKIYPKDGGTDYYGDRNYALACSGDGQPLYSYDYVGSGDEWTLEDAGDGSCYVKNNNGCYWAYQGSSDDEEMKCTIDKSSAVKVKLTWDSKNGGVCFWNDIDGSGLIDYDGWFYWWAYPDEDDPYNEVTFDIALLKEGSGSDFVQKEMTTVVDGIKYSLDANQKTAKVIANNHSYSGDIDIPANITYDNVVYKVNALGFGCFADCEVLKSIKLPDGITSIGGRCFRDCSSLTNIYLPLGLTTLGGNSTPEDTDMGSGPVDETESVRFLHGCFSGCSSLTSINLPSGITSLGGDCFSGCRILTNINLPSGITSLGDNCFFGCRSLTSIKLPSGITSLGDRCFRDCSSLTSVSLPSGINSLGEYCFLGCKGLASIYMYAEKLPTMGNMVFENCDADNCTLYVPKGTIDMYRQSDFGYFKNIVELDATGINNPAASTNLKEVYRYTTNGRRLLTPTKGVNVVKYNNGSVKKVFVK